MKTQSYSNHVRKHPVYHYVAIPISIALIPASILLINSENKLVGSLLMLTGILLHLSIFLLRDYAKKNQDRIIRLEIRMRYFMLTGKRLEVLEPLFSIAQLAAMRFASDLEFLELIHDPGTQKKSPKQIKQSIIQWEADWMRV